MNTDQAVRIYESSAAATGAPHTALLARARSVLGSFTPAGTCTMRGADEVPAPGLFDRTVLLSRGATCGITRSHGGRHELTYADPADPAVLAALIACAAPAGSPVAADPETLSILALAERLAQAEIPVLINGPTGTGKEVLSRYIHLRSPRAAAPFIAINCAAMPETMLEAMLFGHQKGAFTGANAAAEGFFRDLEQSGAFDGRGGAREIVLDEVRRQTHSVEDLGAAIGLVGRDAHLGHDLQNALADRLDVVLLNLVGRQG